MTSIKLDDFLRNSQKSLVASVASTDAHYMKQLVDNLVHRLRLEGIDSNHILSASTHLGLACDDLTRQAKMASAKANLSAEAA